MTATQAGRQEELETSFEGVEAVSAPLQRLKDKEKRIAKFPVIEVFVSGVSSLLILIKFSQHTPHRPFIFCHFLARVPAVG